MNFEDRFCHICGSIVRTTDSFCSNCGTQFQVLLEGQVSQSSIQVSGSAFSDILDHAFQFYKTRTGSREVGGLLISMLQDDQLIIRRAIRACEGSTVEVDISRDAPALFESLYEQGSLREEKGEFIGGWYHSHPGYGVFLSMTDRETQWNCFQRRNGYSVALVVDPSLRKSDCIGAFRVRPDSAIIQIPLKIV
jgi:proteasome lid subunit RPN8/RPN11